MFVQVCGLLMTLDRESGIRVCGCWDEDLFPAWCGDQYTADEEQQASEVDLLTVTAKGWLCSKALRYTQPYLSYAESLIYDTHDSNHYRIGATLC